MSDERDARGLNYNLDLSREQRTNIPEVIFAYRKDDSTLLEATSILLEKEGRALVTKCSSEQFALLSRTFQENIMAADSTAGIVAISRSKERAEEKGNIAVVSAGSSDYPVAEEAAITAEFLGLHVSRHYDCGVAGVHRAEPLFKEAESGDLDIIIAVAGMEGALPSLIAGKVKQPIVAVPTSVGYGTSMDGLAALLGMLNSCAPGIQVVNIDNGFGAAASAYKMVAWIRR